jgi:hypothetical protein
MKGKYYRDKEFDCQLLFQSENYKTIEKIQNEISEHENKIKILNSKIKNIYSNCQHEYYIFSSGGYGDVYKCIKCGHYR